MGCASKQHVSTSVDSKDLNTQGITSVSKKESKAQYQFIKAEGLFLIEEYENALISFDTVLSYTPNNSAVYFKMSQCHEHLENISDAISYAKKAIAGNSSNVYYHLQLVHLYVQQKDFLNEIETYKKLISDVSNSEEYYLALANRYDEFAVSNKKKSEFHLAQNEVEDREIAKQAKNKYLAFTDSSIATLNKYQKEYVLTGEQFLWKQKMLLSRDLQDQAIKESLHRLQSGHPEMLWNHVNLLYRSKSLSEAIDFLESDESVSVEAIERHKISGILHFLNGDEEIVKKEFRALLSHTKFTTEQKYNSLESILKDDTYGKLIIQLIPEVNKFTNQNLSDPDAKELLADFYAYQKNNAIEARVWYEKVLQNVPERERVYLKLLELDRFLEDHNSVIKHGKLLVRQTEVKPLVYDYLANAYVANKEFLHAIRVIHKGLAEIDDDFGLENDFHLKLIDIHQRAEDWDSVYYYYEKSLEYDINNAIVINDYCRAILENDGDIDVARANGERMIRLFPKNGEYLHTYALVLLKAEEPKRALGYIEEALEREKLNVSIYEDAGDIAKAIGDREKAKTYWSKSLELGNDSARLLQKINKLEE